MSKGFLREFLLMAGLLAPLGCVVTNAPPIRMYHLHGVIVSLDAENHTASIKHQEIKGFMEAMTMEFPVRKADEFARLRLNETIDATVFVQDTDFWVGDIQETK